MAATGLSPAGVANATCAFVNGTPVGPGCYRPSAGSRPSSTSVVAALHPMSAAPVVLPQSVPVNADGSDPVVVADSMLGSDAFGPYGCEDFVDAAYGRSTATGIAHDAALSFYQSLADRGLAHHETPIPAGALVFSNGPDGGHVDISRGDGTYVSGGVQGLSPGYGDGHNVQILPAPNLGTFTLSGWSYAPW